MHDDLAARLEAVPWHDIDEDIRPLVRAMQQFGCDTLYSCAGHEDGDEAYVSFRAVRRIEDFLRVASPLRIGSAGKPTRWLGVRIEVDAFYGLRFSIRILAPTIPILRDLTARLVKAVETEKPWIECSPPRMTKRPLDIRDHGMGGRS